VVISADLAKLDDRRHLRPIKLTLGLLLELSQNILDVRVIAEPTALQLGLEHVLSRTINKHTPCLNALARTDFLEDELGSGLLALVQGRVNSGAPGIDNSEYNPLAKPLGRLGIVKGVMY
jgi:hypothetical protein